MTAQDPPPAAKRSAGKEPSKDFIENVPKHLRTFYSELKNELAKNFSISEKGISRNRYSKDGEVFCSAFRVAAFVCDEKTNQWSRLVELVAPDDRIVECVIPNGTLDGRPRDAIRTLSNAGLRVFEDNRIDEILGLIRKWPLSEKPLHILVDKVGWTADREAFLLPNGGCIPRSGTSPLYRLMGDPVGACIGNITVWRDGVAALAVNNTNLLFALSLGFSTALLAFTDLNSVIFHFHRKTSKGKTRVLQAALTIWPKIGEKVKTWDATINGLEGEIARSNSILMGLDELPKDASSDFGNMIYKVANGVGKARGQKDGTAQARKSWQTSVISTGENSVLETLKGLGKRPTGGQGVRIIDIPADGAYGVFDELHGHSTSDAFLTSLDRSIKSASGSAGAAFVTHLMALPTDDLATQLEADAGKHAAALYDHLGVVDGDDETTEIRRVLKSFALISVAGEWATKWGLTGWDAGVAEAAVRDVARRWLVGRHNVPTPQSSVVRKTRDYLTANHVHFLAISDVKLTPNGAAQPLGYRDDDYFYILSPTIPKIAGADTAIPLLLSSLKDSGHLDTGRQKSTYQYKMSQTALGRPNVYRIRREILDAYAANATICS